MSNTLRVPVSVDSRVLKLVGFDKILENIGEQIDGQRALLANGQLDKIVVEITVDKGENHDRPESDSK